MKTEILRTLRSGQVTSHTGVFYNVLINFFLLTIPRKRGKRILAHISEITVLYGREGVVKESNSFVETQREGDGERGPYSSSIYSTFIRLLGASQTNGQH